MPCYRVVQKQNQKQVVPTSVPHPLLLSNYTRRGICSLHTIPEYSIMPRSSHAFLQSSWQPVDTSVLFAEAGEEDEVVLVAEEALTRVVEGAGGVEVGQEGVVEAVGAVVA